MSAATATYTTKLGNDDDDVTTLGKKMKVLKLDIINMNFNFYSMLTMMID